MLFGRMEMDSSRDALTLHDAFGEREKEYDSLRAAGNWAGAMLHAGILLEVALNLFLLLVSGEFMSTLFHRGLRITKNIKTKTS